MRSEAEARERRRNIRITACSIECEESEGEIVWDWGGREMVGSGGKNKSDILELISKRRKKMLRGRREDHPRMREENSRWK
jgi:hypothetical protein